MIGSLTFTRDDGETFTFSAVNPPYQLTPETQLPAGLALDVSGGEYTGRNGGYTLAGRLQRRTAKIVYNVRETYSDSRSMMQLLNDAAEFFRPMTADLRIVSFDMLVQTDDGGKSAYVMHKGHVTTPFMAPLLRGGRGSYAAEFDLIFDDPLLYWADGSGVVSGDILPAALPGSKIGETWREGLQVWAAGLSRWEYPDQGGGGTPQTVHVVSAYQVPVAFKVTGQITNPKIVNSRNGSQWSWEGTIPYGCVVTVDVDGVALDWHGNRLLNTMGGLVAAPGDNTFTLTGGDLVLAQTPSGQMLDLKAAWTGTPNASTSTLSQDGTVVATNLFPTPRLASAYLGNTSITQTDDGFTIKTNTTYTGSGDDHNLYPQNVVAGETYHLHAETDDVLTDTLPDISIWISRMEPYPVSVPNTYLSSPSVIDIDIDIPSAGRIDRITFKCGMTAGDHVTWRRIGLYTVAEWQAMQALGVDWFDGDSVFNNIVTAKASVEIRGAF